MKDFRVISISHKTVNLRQLSRFILSNDSVSGDMEIRERLTTVKSEFQIEELMYLATCNRMTFFFFGPLTLDRDFLLRFFKIVNPGLSSTELQQAAKVSEVFEGNAAVHHIFETTASLNSLVVGEREIFKQVKDAYDRCKEWGLTGDHLRLAIKAAIETAKSVFLETGINQKPVSVVSLAVRKLLQHNLPKDTRFLIIGAGQTNNLLAKFLPKHGFHHFAVFNRTFEHAEKLAEKLNGVAFPLSYLDKYEKPFDVIITCTGATEPVITGRIFEKLTATNPGRKIILDLGIPHNTASEVAYRSDVEYIEIDMLKNEAAENLQFRKQEMGKASEILAEGMEKFCLRHRERQVEKAMNEIPQQIRAIRDKALTQVFSKEVEQLDPESKRVLESVIDYLEKKYISIPITTAKKALVEKAR